MSGQPLFQRNWRVTVNTLQIGTGDPNKQNVDVQFEVKKTLRPEPNTCTLRIYNLSKAHRKQIEQQGSSPSGKTMKIPVKIEAGYGNVLSQIYLGQLRAGHTEVDGPEIVTELSTGDGEKQFATARLNLAMGPSTPIDSAMKEILSVLGVGEGNIDRAILLMRAKGIVQFNVKATILKGNAADHLTDITKGAGLEWSVQDGQVQILPLGQPLQGQSLRISSDSGLVGTPSVDSKGILSFEALMIPGLLPGALILMDAENVRGGYRLSVIEYSGDTLGNDWLAKCQAEKF